MFIIVICLAEAPFFKTLQESDAPESVVIKENEGLWVYLGMELPIGAGRFYGDRFKPGDVVGVFDSRIATHRDTYARVVHHLADSKQPKRVA